MADKPKNPGRTHGTNPTYDPKTPADLEEFYSVYRASRKNKAEVARQLTQRQGFKISRHVVNRICEDHHFEDRYDAEKVVAISRGTKNPDAVAGRMFDFAKIADRPHSEIVREFRGIVGGAIEAAKGYLDRILSKDTFPEVKVSDMLRLWQLYQEITSEDDRLQAIARRKKGKSVVTASYAIHGEVHRLTALPGGKK